MSVLHRLVRCRTCGDEFLWALSQGYKEEMGRECQCDNSKKNWRMKTVPDGVMAVFKERMEGTHYEIGDPEFFGRIPIRQEIVVLPADVPKGCMRVENERREHA